VATSGSGDLILFDLRTVFLLSFLDSDSSSPVHNAGIRAAGTQLCLLRNLFQASLTVSSFCKLVERWINSVIEIYPVLLTLSSVWDPNRLQGLCSQTDCSLEIVIPNYSIFCAAAHPDKQSNELVIGGGASGQNSFMGALIHVVSVWDGLAT
jgi:hypothetical protein